MRLVGLVALAVIAVSSSANAGDGCRSGSVVQHIFEHADRDQNGSLTQAEYEGAGLQHYGISFEESDTNADGQTSMAEYLELYERYHPPVDGAEV